MSVSSGDSRDLESPGKTLRNSKVRAAKDHGKKFRGSLATSFSGIVHFTPQSVSNVLSSGL